MGGNPGGRSQRGPRHRLLGPFSPQGQGQLRPFLDLGQRRGVRDPPRNSPTSPGAQKAASPVPAVPPEGMLRTWPGRRARPAEQARRPRGGRVRARPEVGAAGSGTKRRRRRAGTAGGANTTWRRGSYKTRLGLLPETESGGHLQGVRPRVVPGSARGWGLGNRGPPSPPVCAKRAAAGGRGLGAAPQPARGGTSWSEAARQSLSWAGGSEAPPIRLTRPTPPSSCCRRGRGPRGRGPLGAGRPCSRLSASLRRPVLGLPRGHLRDAP